MQHAHTATDVKARLHNQIEQVLAHLWPAGKVIGHEFVLGDSAGSAGKSLKVELRGPKTGVWCDFSSGEAGDILDAWCKAKGMEFGDAFRDACSFLGLSSIERAVKKQKPPAPDMTGVGKLKGTPVHEYLNGRGISDAAIIHYRIGSHQRPSPHNQHFVLFQFWDYESTLIKSAPPVFIKSTGTEKRPDGSKDIWSSPPWYTLWGWWTVKASDRACVITEGEFDACAVWQLEPGIPVLSLPSGCSNMTWIENDFDTLHRFERIYICTDMDEAGERAAIEIAKRLGPTRCFRLPVPGGYKDANECCTKAEPELLEWDVWLKGAKTYDPATLRNAGTFLEEATRLLQQWDVDEDKPNFCLPELKFSIRPGESTLLTGISTHGKSELAYQTFLSEMRNGHRALVCSFEIDPAEMVNNFAHQYFGKKPNKEELAKFLAWVSDRLWFYVPKEDVKRNGWQGMMADLQYAVQRFGCDRFLIDSIMFVCPKDEYEKQDEFCEDIRNFDRRNNTHTFLIAHCSTKKKETDIPGVADILGSGGIIAPFSNILIVWRNLEKEEKMADALRTTDTTEIEKLKKTHDGLVMVKKQRRTGKHPKVKVWFNPLSRTFRTAMEIPPPPETPEMF